MIAELKESMYQKVVEELKHNRHTHVTSVMVTESRLNELRKRFVSARVPYNGEGVCYLLCR